MKLSETNETTSFNTTNNCLIQDVALQNSNRENRDRYRLDSIEESFDLNDETNNMLSLYSSTSSTSSVPPAISNNSPPKAASNSHFNDGVMLNTMQDSSQISFNNKINNNVKSDESHLDNSSSFTIDYIQENKTIINGIHVRAAKLSKLIEILIESFGKLFNYIFLCLN